MSFLELAGGPFPVHWADLSGSSGFPPGQLYITYSLTVVLYTLFAAKFGVADGKKPSATATKMVRKFGMFALIVSAFAWGEVLVMLCASILSHSHIAARISLFVNALVVLATYALMCFWLWQCTKWKVQLKIPA